MVTLKKPQSDEGVSRILFGAVVCTVLVAGFGFFAIAAFAPQDQQPDDGYNQAFAAGACAWYAHTAANNLDTSCKTCVVAVSDTEARPYTIKDIHTEDCSR